jgi:hypothetical protein
VASDMKEQMHKHIGYTGRLMNVVSQRHFHRET